MDHKDIAARLDAIEAALGRFRLPDHRRTAETCLADIGEIRASVQSLIQDLGARSSTTGRPLFPAAAAHGMRRQAVPFAGIAGRMPRPPLR